MQRWDTLTKTGYEPLMASEETTEIEDPSWSVCIDLKIRLVPSP